MLLIFVERGPICVVSCPCLVPDGGMRMGHGICQQVRAAMGPR
jgi:hypothetical protein